MEIWSPYLVVTIVAGIIVALVVGAYFKSRMIRDVFLTGYKPVPSTLYLDPIRLQYRCERDGICYPEFLARAAQLAIECLVAHATLWERPSIERALADLRVYIKATASFNSTWHEGRIAGMYLAEYHIAVVGLDLSALCREFAEVCLTRLSLINDPNHERWGSLGLHAACATYQDRLGAL